MSTFNDLNNWALTTYAQQNLSELFQHKDVQKLEWLQKLYPLLQLGLGYGLQLIINLLSATQTITPILSGQPSGLINPESFSTPSNLQLAGTPLKPLSSLPKPDRVVGLDSSNPSIIAPEDAIMTDIPELEGTPLVKPKNISTTLKGLTTGASALAGAGASYGLNALGNEIFGDSEGGQFTTGVMSQVGGNVAGNVAGTLAGNALGTTSQSVGQGLSSLGSAASLTSGAAALGNIALDTFDPVKKHWAENVTGLGASVAALAIPGAGPFIAAGLLAANAVGHIFGKKTLTYTRDAELESQMGSSYGEFLFNSASADALADTKYSAFNSSLRKKDDKYISDVKRLMSDLISIRDLALDRFAIKNSMAAINGNRRVLELQGGYLQGAIHSAKHGGRISKILEKYNERFKEVDLKPISFITPILSEEISFITPVESESISFITPIEEVAEFKEGGSFNVIPDGALHAHLHHMENAENLTKKGIPVVSEDEDGELELHAEIEREEIIYRLSVTKQLEELCEKYNSDEYTLKEKDLFAIEAGKLIVYETLYNTQDNVGLLLN